MFEWLSMKVDTPTFPPSVVTLNREVLHLLGRKHAVAVLRWLVDRPGGSTLTEIDYGVVHSHPSTRSIMDALLKADFVERDSNKRFAVTNRGRGALSVIQGESAKPSRPVFREMARDTPDSATH
jgi:predicted transcriptional regulator